MLNKQAIPKTRKRVGVVHWTRDDTVVHHNQSAKAGYQLEFVRNVPDSIYDEMLTKVAKIKRCLHPDARLPKSHYGKNEHQ